MDESTGRHPAELGEVGPSAKSGIAHEQRLAETQLAQVVLDPLHGGHVGRVARQAQERTGIPSPVTASATITCGSWSRPSLLWPRLRRGAKVGTRHSWLALSSSSHSNQAVVASQNQVDVEPEQIDAVPEHPRLDRIAMLGEQVQRPIELVEGKIAGRGQPDALQPALVAASLEPGWAMSCAVIASNAASCGARRPSAQSLAATAGPMPSRAHSC